jgi:hypothetical protein
MSDSDDEARVPHDPPNVGRVVFRCLCGRFVPRPLFDERGFVRCLVCMLASEIWEAPHGRLF